MSGRVSGNWRHQSMYNLLESWTLVIWNLFFYLQMNAFIGRNNVKIIILFSLFNVTNRYYSITSCYIIYMCIHKTIYVYIRSKWWIPSAVPDLPCIKKNISSAIHVRIYSYILHLFIYKCCSYTHKFMYYKIKIRLALDERCNNMKRINADDYFSDTWSSKSYGQSFWRGIIAVWLKRSF